MPHIHKLYDFVVSVFIIHRNKVLLIYHKRYNEWLPIGGHIELHEDPEQALYREIKEECGLKVRILTHAPKIQHPGVKPLPTPSFVDAHKIDRNHRHIAFIYFGISENNRVKLHTREHREFGWFDEAGLRSPRLKLTRSIRFYCVEALKAAKRASKIALWALFFILFSNSAQATEIEYAKVLDVYGKAEVLSSSGGRWKPLSKEMVLKKGSKIRTRSKSFVQIAFDHRLVGLARLDENSRLDILSNPPEKVSLERGALFIFHEDEVPEPVQIPTLRVLTKDALIQVGFGGCMIHVLKESTLIRVFGEKVEVLKSERLIVEEGFKFFTSQSSSKDSLERMRFSDYAEWQAWIKQLYLIKDGRIASALEKELAF